MTILLPVYVGLMMLSGLEVPTPIVDNSPLASQEQTVRPEATGPCGVDKPTHANMQTSPNILLKKLAEYESVCQAGLADKFMFFAGMPANIEEVDEQASYVAINLKEFAKYNIEPIVIFEPNSDSANLFDSKESREGKFNVLLEEFYKTLKAKGVTDAMMGTWVPFPEFNAPIWFSTDSALFAANVTTAVQMQKTYFPGSKASILLNSQTYPSHDENWEFGKYESLTPYVKDIPDGLLDSIGYQGFPWASPANSSPQRKLFNAGEFLRPDLIKAAAAELGVNNVWFNTGTFKRSYAQEPAKTVTVDAQTRQDILNSILVQAENVKAAGLNVAINLFAEDKTAVNEQVDWSYWPQGQPDQSDATAVFKQFVSDTYSKDIGLSLYDAYRN